MAHRNVKSDQTTVTAMKTAAKALLAAEFGAEKFGRLPACGRLGFRWLHSESGLWFALFFSRVSGVKADVWRVTAGSPGDNLLCTRVSTEVSVTRTEVDAAVRWAVEWTISQRTRVSEPPAPPAWLTGHNCRYLWSAAARRRERPDPSERSAATL